MPDMISGKVNPFPEASVLARNLSNYNYMISLTAKVMTLLVVAKLIDLIGIDFGSSGTSDHGVTSHTSHHPTTHSSTMGPAAGAAAGAATGAGLGHHHHHSSHGVADSTSSTPGTGTSMGQSTNSQTPGSGLSGQEVSGNHTVPNMEEAGTGYSGPHTKRGDISAPTGSLPAGTSTSLRPPSTSLSFTLRCVWATVPIMEQIGSQHSGPLAKRGNIPAPAKSLLVSTCFPQIPQIPPSLPVFHPLMCVRWTHCAQHGAGWHRLLWSPYQVR